MLQAIRDKKLIVLALAAGALLAVLTNRLILSDNAISPDEKANLISAKIMSEGKLSIPSPPDNEFYSFNSDNVVNDNKYYGMYPPGWPLFLSLGLLAGWPAAVNLVFEAMTLALVYKIGRRMYSHTAGITAALLMGTSPLVIFNTASYFPHASMLFFITLFTYVYLGELDSKKPVRYAILGAILGIAFNIRPLDAVAVGACFLMHYLATLAGRAKTGSLQAGREIASAAFFAGALAVFLAIFLLYNQTQTGDALLTPFSKYNPENAISFRLDWRQLQSMLWIATSILKALAGWLSYSPAIFLGLLYAKEKLKGTALLLFITPIALIASYSFYVSAGGYQYGPRYIYSSASGVFILIAGGLEWVKGRNNKIFYACLASAIVINAIVYAAAAPVFRDIINVKKAVYDTVNERNISNAVIFLEKRGKGMTFLPMPAGDFTSIDFFNDPIVYASDMGEDNRILMQDYPGRRGYLWKCDLSSERVDWLEVYHIRIVNCTLTQLNASTV
ncbi:MAG: glycosyltransferase family 39 protein [Candidatus Altiarchaeota archaeon]|nr:glycosyltransferase family 39 protein [Candidatus Altiarchaeota archaeon]